MTALARVVACVAALAGALLVAGCSSGNGERRALTPGVLMMRDGSTFKCERGIDMGFVETDCYQGDGRVRVWRSSIDVVKWLTLDPAPGASGRPVPR